MESKLEVHRSKTLAEATDIAWKVFIHLYTYTDFQKMFLNVVRAKIVAYFVLQMLYLLYVLRCSLLYAFHYNIIVNVVITVSVVSTDASQLRIS